MTARRDFQAEREELDNEDMSGRADLMAADCLQAMLGFVFDGRRKDSLSETEQGFARALADRLAAGLLRDSELIFLTEGTTREETTEAVEVAVDAAKRVLLEALDEAHRQHPVRQRDYKKLRDHIVENEGLDSPEQKAERDAWLAALPTCDGCGR